MGNNITFDERFSKEENQVYIAMAGDKDEMIKKLERIINDIREHGRPIYENSTSFKLECQVKRPIWNGKIG